MENIKSSNFEEILNKPKIIPRFLLPGSQWALVLSIACFLIIVSFYNYLLFHTLVEFIAIAIAVFLSIVVWQTYPISKNHFLMFLGTGYIWIAVLDAMHTLVYKGMVMFPISEANHATQFWVSARYFEALVLLCAPLFIVYSLRRDWATYIFAMLTTILFILIMQGYFPDAYIEGKGLTSFKVYSEYLIMALLVGAIVHMWQYQYQISRYILVLMTASIFLTICAEFIFTFYTDVYGILNLSGHMFKLLSYWFIYEAIIRTTLKEPFIALNQELINEINERKILEEKLKFQATHDPLTGLSNRYTFDLQMTLEMERAIRYEHSLSVFMIDIDYFKQVNDTYGHQVGDDVLRNIATLLKRTVRNSDYIARYGGEEFIVILPETSSHKAEELAERLKSQVEDKLITINGDKVLKLTISVGIASYPGNAQNAQSLVKAADNAMYAAKSAGRNQVKLAVK